MNSTMTNHSAVPIQNSTAVGASAADNAATGWQQDSGVLHCHQWANCMEQLQQLCSIRQFTGGF